MPNIAPIFAAWIIGIITGGILGHYKPESPKPLFIGMVSIGICFLIAWIGGA